MLNSPDNLKPKTRSGMPLRVAVVGGLGLFLFLVLFGRLWSLQVISGGSYLADANDNRTRDIRVLPPRGEILDRDGNVLVANRISMALQIDPTKVPQRPEKRRKLLSSLAGITSIPERRLRRNLRSELKNDPGAPVTLAKDVPDDVVYYLEEHQAEFPMLEVNRVFVRKYPNGTEAAHMLGYVSEVNADDLKEKKNKKLVAGDMIGRGGIEQSYDRYLRGKPGVTRIQVDSTGRVTGQLRDTPPVPGDSVRLTIDPEIQNAGEAALSAQGLPGAFVAMNVNSGDIIGMASNPTFDPTIFTKPMTQSQVNALWSDDEGAPMFNRAIAGAYPTGSSFKPITAMAGLNSGTITPSTVVYDGGSITIGDQEFTNAGNAVNGPVDLVDALRVSSDVYFYKLGAELNDGDQLQKWAHMLGIGRDTGIDLPGEAPGLLPSKSWRNKLYAKGDADAPWTIGQNVQLAIGQGDLQADPLQMAVAYATIANGGRVVTPHLGMEIDDPAGRVLKEFQPKAQRKIHVNPEYRAAILEGLHEAAQSPGGTSYAVFGGFPVEMGGKTGTAERPPNGDQSWYVALAPIDDPRIVIAATFERGGFGADTAAPAVESIMSAYFGKQATPVGAGEGRTE